MPSDIRTPDCAAAVDRLSLVADTVRGARSSIIASCWTCGSCACFADEAEPSTPGSCCLLCSCVDVD